MSEVQPKSRLTYEFHLDRCQQRCCASGIEFDASEFNKGENRTVECPHCHLETIIFAATIANRIPDRNRNISQNLRFYQYFVGCIFVITGLIWFFAARPRKQQRDNKFRSDDQNIYDSHHGNQCGGNDKPDEPNTPPVPKTEQYLKRTTLPLLMSLIRETRLPLMQPKCPEEM